jgi:3-oxoadipate enol-lactonase
MRIRLHDFAMEYDEVGTGRPLLFIHGYPLNRTLWEMQLNGLADAARIVAPDLRGHGASEAVSGPYTMDLLADDCAALLDALGATEPAVVCGLSMGGYVALAFQRRYPDRVAALVLTATRATPDSPEGKKARDGAMATAREQGLDAIVEAMLPKMLSPKTFASRPDLVERARRMMRTTSLEGVLGDLAAMRDRPDSRPGLASILRPALIVHGADDQLIPPAEGDAMHQAIAGSRIRIIPSAGHLPNLEQPDAYNAAVRDFLKMF